MISREKNMLVSKKCVSCVVNSPPRLKRNKKYDNTVPKRTEIVTMMTLRRGDMDNSGFGASVGYNEVVVFLSFLNQQVTSLQEPLGCLHERRINDFLFIDTHTAGQNKLSCFTS